MPTERFNLLLVLESTTNIVLGCIRVTCLKLSQNHSHGIDIGAPVGTPIYAFDNGRILIKGSILSPMIMDT